MREEVFVPLGLTRTSVHIGPGLEDFTATRYAPDGTPLPFYDFDHAGGSAIFSSAHDLIRFGMFHLKNHLADQRPVLTDESIDEMHRPTALEPDGSGNGYGIGWNVGVSNNGLRTISHGGGMGGVSTTLRLIPDENAVVVVLCNSSNGDLTWRISEEIVVALAPGKIKERAPNRSVSRNSPQPAGPRFEPMPELSGTWSGEVATYEGALPVTFVIRESGEVYIQLDGRPWTVLDQARFADSVLSGTLAGDVGTEDANRRPYNLRLEVKKRGNVLNGSLIALSLPGNRTGNALTHWIKVERH